MMIELILGLVAMMFSGTAIGLTAHQVMKKSATTDGKQALPYNKGGIRDFEEQEKKRLDGYTYQVNGTSYITGERDVMEKHKQANGNPEELPKEIQMLNMLYKCNGCELYSRRHDQVTAYLQMEINGEKPADTDEDFMNNFDLYKSKSMSESRYIDQVYGIVPGLRFHTEKVCPHCKKQQRLLYSLDDKEHEWLKHHAHCLELDYVGLIRVNELHEKLRQTIKDQKSAEKFLEYNNLAKTFDEAAQRHVETMKEVEASKTEIKPIHKVTVGNGITEIEVNGILFKFKRVDDRLFLKTGGNGKTEEWILTTYEESNELIKQAERGRKQWPSKRFV